MSFRPKAYLATLVLAALCVTGAQAALVRSMDLPEMCDRAEMIFRGKVLDVTPGTVTAGGGEIPTATYLVQVSEEFKGAFPEAKEGGSVIEITMVSDLKQLPHRIGDVERVPALNDLPRLAIGSEYLLLTTKPSSGGLCTTVGLWQGAFRITNEDKVEMATSGVGMRYAMDDLASQIRSILASQE